MEKEEFINRLVKLRMKKGTSARDMSLSLGQSPNYINNLEAGLSYPSMSTFFYICDYFQITPQEFFDTGSRNPTKIRDLTQAAKELDDERLDHLIAIAKDLGKR